MYLAVSNSKATIHSKTLFPFVEGDPMTALASVSPRDQLIELIGQVSEEQLTLLNPFLAALVEVSKTDDGLEQLDLDEFRENLGLEKILPEPTITELSGVTLAGSEVSLEDQKAAGKYDWMNSDITVERFPLTLPAGSQDLILAHFDVDVKSEQVEIWAKEHGYELALIDDLLAVGSHSEYRELLLKFPIVALMSSTIVDGERRVPCLGRRDSGRGFYLLGWERVWGASYQFLLRKVSTLSAT